MGLALRWCLLTLLLTAALRCSAAPRVISGEKEDKYVNGQARFWTKPGDGEVEADAGSAAGSVEETSLLSTVLTKLLFIIPE